MKQEPSDAPTGLWATPLHQFLWATIAITLCILFAGCSPDHSADLTAHRMTEYAAPAARPNKIRWFSTSEGLWGTYFDPDLTHGWVVGAHGTLLKTDDRGKSWVAVEDVPTEDNLYAVVFSPDGQQGWAVGASGTVVHSLDQGGSWNLLPNIPTRVDLRSICFTRDGRVGWIAGNYGTILRSQDYGLTWTQSQAVPSREHLRSVQCVDTQHAWAVGTGGTVLSTADSGVAWTRLPASVGWAADFWSVKFASDARHGCVVGTKSSIFCTADGGMNWVTGKRNLTEDVLRDLYVSPDGTHWWASGTNGRILDSNDSGVTWSEGTREFSDTDLHNVVFSSDLRYGWLTGSGGTILRTEDGGGRWSEVRSPAAKSTVASVQFATDQLHGWAVGANGTLLHTENGGSEWSRVSQTLPYEDLWSVHFNRDGQHGWAAGNHAIILRTTDAGKTWEDLGVPEIADLHAIEFANDAQHGWVVGTHGAIWRTENGGHNWLAVKGVPTTNNLAAVSFSSDGTHGLVVGAHGTILLSDDAGLSWSPIQANITSEPDLLAVQILANNPQEAWVSGSGGALLHSLDGGRTWTAAHYVQTPTALWGLQFTADGRAGWVVGSRGVRLHTEDSGVTWSTVEGIPVDSDLLGVSIGQDGERAWMVGTEGTILNAWPDKTQQFPVILSVRGQADPRTAHLDVRYVPGTACERPPTAEFLYLPAGVPSYREKPIASVSLQGDGLRTRKVTLDIREFRLNRGAEIQLGVRLTCNEFTEIYRLGGLSVGSWTDVIPGGEQTIWYLSAFLVPPCIAILLFIFKPALLVSWRYLRWSGEGLPEWLRNIYAFLVVWTLVPLLSRHIRVIDAWVDGKARGFKEQWEQMPLIERTQGYVPLPVEIKAALNTEVVIEPGPAGFQHLFQKNRSWIQIIGVGGAGKTTLALRLARWCFASDGGQPLSGFRMLPIVIADELTDVSEFVRRELSSLVGEEVDESWLKILLKSQRVLIVVDRLSELSEGTQKQIHNIFTPKTPVNALIVTARRAIELNRTSVEVRPLPLSRASSLALFIERELPLRKAGLNETTERESERLDLAHRLAVLVEKSAGGAATPLLAKLYIEEAIDLAKQAQPLEALSRSIPEIYFRYLDRVNPSNKEAAHFLANESMRRGTAMIAACALKGSYVPRDFLRSVTLKVLLDRKFPAELIDSLFSQLKSTGIISGTAHADDEELRFTLDPVAEHLGAFRLAQDWGDDRETWQAKYREIQALGEQVDGFAMALRLVHQAYAAMWGWPNWPAIQLPDKEADVSYG